MPSVRKFLRYLLLTTSFLLAIASAFVWLRGRDHRNWIAYGYHYIPSNRSDHVGFLSYDGELLFYQAIGISKGEGRPGWHAFSENSANRFDFDDFSCCLAEKNIVTYGYDIQFIGFRFMWLRDWSMGACTGQPFPTSPVRAVILPCWFVTTLFLIAPLLSLRRILPRRAKPGLCRSCAYDLRASRERCPECGTPVPQKAEPAA